MKTPILAILLSVTLVSTGLAAPTTAPGGVGNAGGTFASYFQNMTGAPCGLGMVVAGFKTTQTDYLKPNCLSIGSILTSFFGNYTIPTGKMVVGFDPTSGDPIFGDVGSTGGSSGWGLSGNTGTTAGTNFIGTTDAVGLSIRTNNTNQVTITSGGNVGIGESNPLVKFDVNGRIQSSGSLTSLSSGPALYLQDTDSLGAILFANVDKFFISSTAINARTPLTYPFTINLANGNVGIGEIDPVAKLEVNGNIKIGDSGTACSSTTEGQIRYNSTTKVMEFCNGTAWRNLAGVVPIDGACNPVFSATTLTTGTCAGGSPTAISGTGPWTWGCDGVDGGTNTLANACSATKKVNAICGSSALSCTAGTLTVGSDNGQTSCDNTRTWGCTGVNGGTSTAPTACTRYNGDCAAAATSGPYSYTAWNPAVCSVSCGGGTQTRIESCNYDSCEATSQQPTSQSCNTQPCVVHCESSYGDCSQTCGPGIKTLTINKYPSPGGTACPPATVACNNRACIKGTYTYGDWGACQKVYSSTCSPGFKSRTATCTGGDFCDGPIDNIQSCDMPGCTWIMDPSSTPVWYCKASPITTGTTPTAPSGACTYGSPSRVTTTISYDNYNTTNCPGQHEYTYNYIGYDCN